MKLKPEEKEEKRTGSGVSGHGVGEVCVCGKDKAAGVSLTSLGFSSPPSHSRPQTQARSAPARLTRVRARAAQPDKGLGCRRDGTNQSR
jgi:hypothetical protein